MLSMLAEFIDNIPSLSVDGIYGPATESAVRAAQRWFGLPVTGITDSATWDAIYDQFSGIENTTLRNREIFPESSNANGRTRYAFTSTQTQFPGTNLQTGSRDPVSQEVIR